MSPELFLSIVAAVFSLLGFLIALTAYAAVKGINRKREEAGQQARKMEIRDLAALLTLEDDQRSLVNPETAALPLARLCMQILAALILAMWRAGLLTANSVIGLRPSASYRLSEIFPEIFLVSPGTEPAGAPAEDASADQEEQAASDTE